MDDCGFDGSCVAGISGAELIGVGSLYQAGQNDQEARGATPADAWLTGLLVALCLALACLVVLGKSAGGASNPVEHRNAAPASVGRSVVLFLPA